MNKTRLEKLESVAKQITWEFLIEDIRQQETKFGIINISWVKISPDVSYLDIFVSSFENSDKLTKTLAKYAPSLTKKIHKNLNIRKLPKIRFRYDNSWEISQNILKTINNL